ncbi:MAG: sugar transferase [Chloroflexota bacterium]
METVTASVIIPAYNADATIAACLNALARQTLARAQYEIIVVDDGATDATRALAEKHPGARVLAMAHRGAAAARNLGARAARGAILVFTDADCAPTENWIEAMCAPLADPNVVGAKGIYRTRQRELVARFVQLEYEEKYARMSRASAIDFIDTYSATYRRDLFLANAGFDESFPAASVEDQEFSFRLAKQGHRLVFAPQAIVYHRHVTTLDAYVRRKFRIGYWKVRVHARHPDKVWRDSHTPPTLKWQTVLWLAILAGMGAALVVPMLWGFVALLAAIFFISALPLLVFIARRDPALALVALPLVVARAGALGAGLVAGVFGAIARSARLKRAVDLVGALSGLIVCAPLMLLIALVIKLDSPGPIFFTQIRAGKDGAPFRIIKFRSMVQDAEARLETVLAQSHLPPPVFKIPNDPRVTRVGRILRRLSLDELPQFVNVLKGEMSLVGPRPEETRIVALYDAWHRQRLAVKPGMTGPMQTRARGALSLDERARLELDYIEHYSIAQDFLLLCRTLPAVVRGHGAY